jgi:predicted RNase H-like HicB family nuclease
MASVIKMRYAVVIEHDPETGAYGAYAPDLPGCGAAAATLEEVHMLIREAIQFHIEGLVDETPSIDLPEWE